MTTTAGTSAQWVHFRRDRVGLVVGMPPAAQTLLPVACSMCSGWFAQLCSCLLPTNKPQAWAVALQSSPRSAAAPCLWESTYASCFA